MKIKRFVAFALMVSMISTMLYAQEQEMTKEQWQKAITELTTKRTDLKNKLDGLVKEISDLKQQEAQKVEALKQCQDALAQLQKDYEGPLNAQLDKIDAKLNELSGLSNQDLYVRRAELDTVQAWINAAKQNPLSVVKKYAARINDQQGRLDALKKSLEQIIASGQAMPTYKVGTWAKDRDCLWNIAKKPKIYNNPFLWPKIWQGNRDQIKNPDIIHPGQVLKIPPKADLTKEEKAALRKYWSNKNAAPANP
ncbi:MAG TPA: LysM peptidoglycan-binding domain-containing protein [Bacteroidota bacterium]|nr:LysM peptidoglycan-binding domain-containing protein [Bacteroidota bacterium]